jgi:hypothetical protein
MRLVEIFQHSCLIVRQLNFRNPSHKSVNATNPLQCEKFFYR